jgi:hypothetical protein
MSPIDATASSRRQTGKMQKLPNGEATGVDDAVPEIVWPPRVVQPARPPALVYLDLNHYINLARTAAGLETPDGYDGLLRAATAARKQDRAVFPLSGEHYVEMSGIRDPAQRTAVAEVMESLSGFLVLLGRVTLAELEIDAMIDALLSPGPAAERINLLGPTFGWAFGMRGGLTIRDADGNDSSASMREEVGDREFERIMAEATLAFERGMLAGPPDEEIAALRAVGYAPEKTREVTERRAQQERDLSARLDKEDRWRRGRLRDVVSASELTHEWGSQVTRATHARGTTIGQVVREDRERMRAFAEGMPSSRVAISLKTRYHRDGRHQWTTNDIHDIDALAVAVPYCDAVFTDKAARNALAASPELRSFGTFLPRRPGELGTWLDSRTG